MLRPLAIFLAALIALPAAAQDGNGAPKIGLVLGGGGARGFAHIGVLQVLEENRIPVHAIAGTSMGAVVGSIYAQGNDAREITDLAQSINWTTVFNDAIPRTRKTFRRKQDERDVLVDFRIAFDDGGLVLPKGVLRGQELFLTLAENLVPVRGVNDFDNLATPFRAVATDIETGKAVSMGSGDIVTAVFASMSVPGAFPPVERDGLLLVDGMIAANVPVNEVRAMGAQRLIVVDVGTPLRTRDRLNSFVSVLDQMQLLLGHANVQEQLGTLGEKDILIQPDLGDISATSFDRNADAIATGRKAAIAVLDQLLPLQLSEAEWAAYLAKRSKRTPRKAPVIDFVKINNSSDIPTYVIKEMVEAQPNKPLDAPQMTKDLQDIYALGGFRAVRYGIGPGEKAGTEGLTIQTIGDPTTANWLQLGLGISTDFNRNAAVRIGISYTDRNLLGTAAEWRTDLRIGSNLLMESGVYREFGKFFAEITPYWSRTDTVLYQDGLALGTVRASRIGGRVDGGLLLGRWGELRAGVDWADVDLDTLVGSVPLSALPEQRFDNFQDGSWHVRFTADTLDNINFPTSGTYGYISFINHTRLLGGDLDYNVIEGEFSKPISWGRNTVYLGLKGGFTFDGDGRTLGDFRLGGFLNLSGLEPDELIGRHKLLGRAIFYHRMSEKAPIIDFPFYIGGSLELGNAWSSLSRIDVGSLVPAASLFVATETPIGPISLAAGMARWNPAIYLMLGRQF